jgi:hypothetical protein
MMYGEDYLKTVAGIASSLNSIASKLVKVKSLSTSEICGAQISISVPGREVFIDLHSVPARKLIKHLEDLLASDYSTTEDALLEVMRKQ